LLRLLARGLVAVRPGPRPDLGSSKKRKAPESPEIEGPFLGHAEFAGVGGADFRVVDRPAFPAPAFPQRESFEYPQTDNGTRALGRIGILAVKFYLARVGVVGEAACVAPGRASKNHGRQRRMERRRIGVGALSPGESVKTKAILSSGQIAVAGEAETGRWSWHFSNPP